MYKVLGRIGFIFILLSGIYFAGPAPRQPEWNLSMPQVPADPEQLEAYIEKNESLHAIKPDNGARILWQDSARSKTPYSIIYLHGFSASQEEGDPVHTDFAKKFGCNLYLARLADHGVDTTEQLLTFTADRLWNSAKEALAIGKAIGEKVIILSTSTGGTLALMLAAEYPQDVHALVSMSPNIAINNPTAFLLNNPWGLQIARLVIGGRYQKSDYNEKRKQYWNDNYRLEALTQLQEIIEEKMNKATFQRVVQPSLTLYYYKDEQHQDPTVKVSAMIQMHAQLATPDSLKQAIALPDAGAHVIGSHLVSRDLQSVTDAVNRFAIEKLHLAPIN